MNYLLLLVPQVFIFGSVPLKTYLPDGDIDLTAFSDDKDFKDSLVHEVRGVLEKEGKNENAEFRVQEVQYIEAEVTILKCLVDKFVVDISFNQISGLCTLCFLEEVDSLIIQNHLFKRSIILIKTWCFHESRILGAHHGLISSYALEVLVLYIFHIYSDKFAFAGPFEVLFRFLEFFSKFDWKNYIISLWGPIPVSSLPNIRAEPPHNDCRELLLEGDFLFACKAFYGVTRRNQESFVSKHLNIVDPLCENNNLGRSISKGNFYRIKSAIALGAERLMRLFECTEDTIAAEFDYFFKNTWDRHGNGHWMNLNNYNLYLKNNPTPQENEIEKAHQASDSVHQNPIFGTFDVSSVNWSTRTSDMKKSLTDIGKTPMYPSNEVHAIMPQVPSQEWRSEEYGLSVDDAMRMQHEEYDLIHLTESYKNHSLHGYIQAPFNVNSNNLPFPSPAPPGFLTPSPGFSPIPPSGFPPPQPPPAAFPTQPPSPGFEHAQSSGVPPVIISSWSYCMPNSDHDNISEGLVSEQDMDGGSSSCNSPFWNSSGTSYLPKEYWDVTEHKWLARENDSDDSPSLSPQLVDATHLAQNKNGIVTSNAQDNRSAGHKRGPIVVPNSSRFSPASSQRGIENQGLSAFPFVQSTPTFPPNTKFTLNNIPILTYTPLNYMEMNVDLVNLNSTQKSGQPNHLLMHNYSSVDETSEPYVGRPWPDILKADFLSHWLNLQHGRRCENPQLQGHLPYLSANVVVPPFYFPPLPAYFPWDVAPRIPTDFMNNMPHCFPPLLFSMLPNLFPQHAFNPCFNNRNVDLTPGYRSAGIGTFLPDPVSYQNRYYRKKNYSLSRNEEGNNGYKRNEDKKEYHHNFDSEERYRRRSVHFGNFRCKTKQYYRRRNNGPAFDASIFDNNSDAIVIVPDEQQPLPSDGTNEASNQGESSQSASNEMENVEGDSADPSPQQSPASDSPGTQDEDMSIFNDADFPRLR
ncbi:PREDICTED: uncharacterized protein LOC109326383 [Lupinus angustifolius]|uniref:uncharacterized protein LOC109326383 n=1 Tax=Lupinus angustifolius TaxID=3871 RepID=UPI00092ED375|nr:PREDICTED: uncharacterized protein LOC109326383 [Lupinus angustifolius]